MMAEPPPTMVIVVPSMVATEVLELEYVIAPSLLVVGATKLNAASPNVFAGIEKFVSAVVILFTVSNAVVVVEAYIAVFACVAVMVEVPGARMVIVFPFTVATLVSELV
jgi:hypothetical protein